MGAPPDRHDQLVGHDLGTLLQLDRDLSLGPADLRWPWLPAAGPRPARPARRPPGRSANGSSRAITRSAASIRVTCEPEAAPGLGHLHPDHPGAQQSQPPGRLLRCRDLAVRPWLRLAQTLDRRDERAGAGGDHHSSFGHEHVVSRAHPALAVEPAVLADQLDPARLEPRELGRVVAIVDHLVAASQGGAHVELAGHRLGSAGHAANLAQRLAGPQQGLRRHAGIEGALASHQLALHQRHAQPGVGQPPGAHLAGRARAQAPPRRSCARSSGSSPARSDGRDRAAAAAVAAAGHEDPPVVRSTATLLGWRTAGKRRSTGQAVSRKCHYLPLVPWPVTAPARSTRGDSPPNGHRREGHQAGLRLAQEALHLQRGARPAARVDRLVRGEGAGPPRRALGGGDLRRLGLRAHGRARLPRPLLPRGVRRSGRRLPVQPRAGRGDHQVQLGRARDGRRGAHRHGHAAGVPVRHRGAEAGVPGARDQGREDLLPGHHRAGRRVRRGGHQDARGPRRRRLGHQRLQDLHHQRPPGALHRARDQDRPRQGLRRLHALPRAHGRARA